MVLNALVSYLRLLVMLIFQPLDFTVPIYGLHLSSSQRLSGGIHGYTVPQCGNYINCSTGVDPDVNVLLPTEALQYCLCNPEQCVSDSPAFKNINATTLLNYLQHRGSIVRNDYASLHYGCLDQCKDKKYLHEAYAYNISSNQFADFYKAAMECIPRCTAMVDFGLVKGPLGHCPMLNPVQNDCVVNNKCNKNDIIHQLDTPVSFLNDNPTLFLSECMCDPDNCSKHVHTNQFKFDIDQAYNDILYNKVDPTIPRDPVIKSYWEKIDSCRKKHD